MSPETESNEKVTDAKSDDTGSPKAKSSLGLEENVGGLLCYLVTFITGIVFYIMEKENDFIRFHALQSIITFGAIMVFFLVLSIIPFIGIILSLLISPVSLVLWIFLMYKAYNGERYKLPIVGDMVENQLNK
ncbi:DUF4870 domain-containing protein [Evansella tamaricis]|uniref:DUF4870 domain-containing protein n=1 Tax=Evansella tamaricis TaxID=2069301 RepID=A0ABS6JMF0_9BACI|nr:DUF4870 domain-containing protein [Evansella tamaricis]MBU9713600.1 DUF4870 domain-containing protein [Evansella tamaricis]